MKRLNSTKYSRKTVKYSATERQTARTDILEEYPIDDRDLEEIIHKKTKEEFREKINVFRKFCYVLYRLNLFNIDNWWDDWDFDHFIGENFVQPPKGWVWDHYTETIHRLPKPNR